MGSEKRVLVTGGAGFIGSHVADALLASGHEVVAYDSLDSQVHGPSGGRPHYLSPDVELVIGDIRDESSLAPQVRSADAVIHLAAAVGVGQSMYDIRRYTDVNAVGVATLLQVLADDRGKVSKLVVASSMSVYGEGAYSCAAHGPVAPAFRPEAQLAAHDWELRCSQCNVPLDPLPTGEEKPLRSASVYASNKRDHEEMCLAVGAAYSIPTVALRFFNVYGPRQALSNPYTGVAAIFSSRLLNGNRPLVFEDGAQSRDLVHVTDVAAGCRLALERSDADGRALNIGSGVRITIAEIAELLANALGHRNLMPELTGRYRAGDVRHCFADISAARDLLGYTPQVRPETGLPQLGQFVAGEQAVDLVARAADELLARGLAR